MYPSKWQVIKLASLFGFVESLVVINDRWLHFADHLLTGVTVTSHPSTCAFRDMHWFI